MWGGGRDGDALSLPLNPAVNLKQLKNKESSLRRSRVGCEGAGLRVVPGSWAGGLLGGL